MTFIMYNKLLTLITIVTLALTASAQVPAFPGAEGHGRYTDGGRGGRLVHVTNLNDKGAGSLREAVKGDDRKIIVFDVGGVIPLESDLTIGKNTTIAGQTAPEPGITLRYYTVKPSENNVIRFLRIRRGQEKDINDGADAIWQRYTTGILLDHCSFSWSIDEVASFYDNNNFTMQWCTIAESLVHPGHSKGAHGYGGIWGGKLASFHHNLIAHVANRSPRFNGARYDGNYTVNKLYEEYQWQNALQAENVDFRNCVVFNCGNGCYGGPGGGQINMVNNYYKSGNGGSTKYITKVSVATPDNATSESPYMGMTSRYYISGNQLDGTQNKDWAGVTYDSGTKTLDGQHYTQDPNHYYAADSWTEIDGVDCLPIKLDSPIPAGEVTTHTATKAFDLVLSYAGASLCRDTVDRRYETETRKGEATYQGSATSYVENGVTKTCTPTYGRIDLVSDVNGYTEADFPTGRRSEDFDTDRDGIPNQWEKANGLDPYDASDAALMTIDSERQWYTNLEVYLNSLVEDIMKAGQADGDDAVEDYYPAWNKPTDDPDEPEDPVYEITDYELSALTNTGTNTSAVYNFTYGFSISNEKGKGYAAGLENGVKYSAGVQYTINLPEGVSISQITFTGYDNYAEADSYLEVEGVSYSDYIFPKKSDGKYVLTTHTITFSTPLTGSITFKPQGKQVVLAITLTNKQAVEPDPDPDPVEGDLDGSGTLDEADVAAFIKHLTGQETPEDFDLDAADINHDGDVNIADVAALIGLILNENNNENNNGDE